jgi:hypothetical protein
MKESVMLLREGQRRQVHLTMVQGLAIAALVLVWFFDHFSSSHWLLHTCALWERLQQALASLWLSTPPPA